MVIRVLLQSERLKEHMVKISVDKSLSNSSLYEHKCLENIKNIYQSDGRYYDQEQCKEIIEADVVSTPESFT